MRQGRGESVNVISEFAERSAGSRLRRRREWRLRVGRAGTDLGGDLGQHLARVVAEARGGDQREEGDVAELVGHVLPTVG